jgi:membrane-associated protein
LSAAALRKGEDLFVRYGPATIFLARFIAGLRILAGPIAGVLRMPWRTFLLFNLLGSILWVTSVSCAAYFFGQHWNRLLKMMGNLNIVFLLVALTVGVLLWWRHRKESSVTKS